MSGWHLLAGDRTELYSPLGLRLIDVVTGQAPIGRITPALDRQDPVTLAWQSTDRRAVITPSQTITYPGLGRRRNPVGLPAERYRVRIDAEFYRPAFLAQVDGLEFLVFPYDDANPPQIITASAQDTSLLPGPAYPFLPLVPVVRGVVLHNGALVENVEVTQGVNLEKTLTDARGVFALPLRQVAVNTPTAIDATDLRTGHTGTLTVTLPAALAQSQTITI